MVGKNTLLAYDFKSINQYFNYIIESKINGQYRQCAELIKKLSKNQKIEFLQELHEYGHHPDIAYLDKLTVELLTK